MGKKRVDLMDMQTFLHMGGYALYVWSSFGIAAVVLVLNFISPIIRHRNLVKQIRKKHTRK